MNTVGLYFLLVMVIATILLVPFSTRYTLESWLVILVFYIVYGSTRYLLFLGKLETAATLMLLPAWFLFIVVAIIAGGIASPLMFAVVASTIVVGLFLERKIGTLLMLASILSGLVIAILQQAGVALPQFFVFPPLAIWLLFALGLFFVHRLMNLVVRSLQDALVLVRQQSEARLQAEQALRQSEERFQMFMRHFPGLAYMKDADGLTLFANQGFATYLNLSPANLTGKTNQAIFGQEFGEKLTQADQEVLQSGGSQVIEEEFAGRTWITHKFCINQPGARPLLGGVTIDDSERKKAETILRMSEARYRILFETLPVGVTVADESGRISKSNLAAERILGLSLAEHTRRKIDGAEWSIIRPDGSPMPADEYASVQALKQQRPVHQVEMGVERGAGEITWLNVNAAPLPGHGVVVTYEDITERKRAAEKIRATLEEKETLLREVHHRVKNNLQVMIALIKMQGRLTNDPQSSKFLQELEGQAYTMALVYEQLYQSENLARVAMAPYLRQLTANIIETFGRGATLQLQVNALAWLDVAQAMPCGLIVNELFTNILKHAFPPDFAGEPAASIQLERVGETFHLKVSDNGVGLPGGFDWQSSQTLGLRLVNLWATHQLGGTLVLSSQHGTTFAITFEVKD